ncbi:hypothetical protein F5Y02DRAFT_51868 [Annulohypoxylon stygium]|nr:hypothetical protein F5Y02DRAFT_51868 [Annulohypoxylon stygium]
MEVLGAVAAAGQLAGTAITILDSISQLRDFLRHAPARYQGWNDELSVLGDTIKSIRDNKALHTCQISRILGNMAPKIEGLRELCAHYAFKPKLRLISKLLKARKARTVESRILQKFQSLEHDKTTLILTINTLNYKTSIETDESESEKESPNMAMPNGNGNGRGFTIPSAPGTPVLGRSPSVLSNQQLARVPPTNYNNAGYNPSQSQNFSWSPAQSPLGQPFSMSTPQPAQQSDDFSFDDIKTGGNGNAVGINGRDSMNHPIKASFKGLTTDGWNNSVGVSSSSALAGSRVPPSQVPVGQNPFNPPMNGGSGGM